MSYKLVVVNSFEKFERGELIGDPAEVARILNSRDLAHNVNKVIIPGLVYSEGYDSERAPEGAELEK